MKWNGIVCLIMSLQNRVNFVLKKENPCQNYFHTALGNQSDTF